MTASRTQILNDNQVKQILRRMAYQVYESNFNEKSLVIAGIAGRGFTIAGMLHEQLSAICKLKLTLIEVKLDKNVLTETGIRLTGNKGDAGAKNILIVDDVLNTGKTMIYAFLPFLKANAGKIQTAVLVDRDHKSFPVNADFIGISLSTTLQEHVSVSIERKKINVYLS